MEKASGKHGRALSKLGASKGGKARAASMTADERKDIARAAAEARWKDHLPEGGRIPKATHEGLLRIGSFELPCAVLEDGTRVLSERGMSTALGHVRSGQEFAKKQAAASGERLPVFLQKDNLKPFISEELSTEMSRPRIYRSLHGGRPAHGISATALPEICEVLLSARDAGVLSATQLRIAAKAELIVRGLARVGIIALIDEATGYQRDRARDELSRILEAYIAKELLPWTKRFPDIFFEQIYRIHGWEYKEGSVKRPQYVGKVINKYVYGRLPPGILKELQQKNPIVNGRRKHAHHQFLTPDTGHPHLDKQITEVTVLMRISRDRFEFEQIFRKAFPSQGDQLPIEFSKDEEE